jgi:hypothetical protein
MNHSKSESRPFGVSGRQSQGEKRGEPGRTRLRNWESVIVNGVMSIVGGNVGGGGCELKYVGITGTGWVSCSLYFDCDCDPTYAL